MSETDLFETPMREFTEDESWVIQLAFDYRNELRAGMKRSAAALLEQMVRALDTLAEQWDGKWEAP